MINIHSNQEVSQEFPILGAMIVKVSVNASPNGNTQWINVKAVGKDVKLTATGSGYFTNSYGGESLGTSITVTAGTSRQVCVPNLAFDIIIEDKYNVGYFGCGASMQTDLKDWEYSQIDDMYFNDPSKSVKGDVKYISELTGLKKALFASDNINGDISAFSDMEAITNLDLYTSKVTGDIVNCGYKPVLVYLGLAKSTVEGDLEDFVKAQVVGGNTNYTALRCNLYQTNVKFKGSVVSIQSDQTYLKWSTSSNVVTINLYNESLSINETTTITIN